MSLILTDIDGTVLPFGYSQISDRTYQAFLSALEAGFTVGPVSGRGRAQMPPFFRNDERVYATCISTNGMVIHYNGEPVRESSISAEEIDALLEAVDDVPHSGLLYFDGATPLLLKGTREDLAQSFEKYAKICIDAPDFHQDGVKINAFVAGGIEEAYELANHLMACVPTLDVDVPQAGYTNIMPRGWNKGTAVLWLADYLGISEDDIFVFGDADNDLTMLKAVKNSVALGEATPAATEAARWHIGKCEDDAVAKAIESLVAGEFPFTK